MNGHIDSNGEFTSDDGKASLGYLCSDKDMEAVKLIGIFRMHNNRIKFKEEQINSPEKILIKMRAKTPGNGIAGRRGEF